MEKKGFVESGFLPRFKKISGNISVYVPIKKDYALLIFNGGLVSKIFMRMSMHWVVIYII